MRQQDTGVPTQTTPLSAGDIAHRCWGASDLQCSSFLKNTYHNESLVGCILQGTVRRTALWPLTFACQPQLQAGGKWQWPLIWQLQQSQEAAAVPEEPPPGTSCHHHTSSLARAANPSQNRQVWPTTLPGAALRPAWLDPDTISWTTQGSHTYPASLLHHTRGFGCWQHIARRWSDPATNKQRRVGQI